MRVEVGIRTQSKNAAPDLCLPHGPLDPDSARKRERDEPLVGFIDRDGNVDGLDPTKPLIVGYDKWGLPLYALRRIIVGPWWGKS